MNEKRKPEWTPLYSGKEFATSVVTGKKSVHIKASPSTKGKKYDLRYFGKGSSKFRANLAGQSKYFDRK
jgi:LAO/AO transport system kinase